MCSVCVCVRACVHVCCQPPSGGHRNVPQRISPRAVKPYQVNLLTYGTVHKKGKKQVTRARECLCSPLGIFKVRNWLAKGLRTAHIKTVCFGGVQCHTYTTESGPISGLLTQAFALLLGHPLTSHTQSDSISINTAHLGFT